MSTINLSHWDKEEDEVDLSTLALDEVAAYFIESEADGDLNALYQILAQESPLREGMTASDWIKRRSEWDDRFEPDNLQLTLLATREIPKVRAWRTTSTNKQSNDTMREVEAGWSLELAEILLETDDRPPELPAPVTVYAESKRHWFWARFILVRENEAWHIQDMTDEYGKARELSVGEIKKRLNEIDRDLEKAIGNKSPDDMLQDYQQAEDLLEKAEQLDPGSELIAEYRQIIMRNKANRHLTAAKPPKLTGAKKKKQKPH